MARQISHPLVAGVAWMVLLGGVGAAFLAVQFLWRRWILSIDAAVLASRDQAWSLGMLVAVGFVVGVVLATLRRRAVEAESC